MDRIDVEATWLWSTALGPRPNDDAEAPRSRLRQSWRALHERAAFISADIQSSMPNFTVHDAGHADSLWQLADILTGSELMLTPTEAYVFGGGCLVHDLAMSVASYPNGLSELEQTAAFHDSVGA